MATYYVKTGGSNSNTGLSDAQAWATLAKAQATVAAGDTLLLNRGNKWREAFTTPVNNLTFDAYGSGALPIIDGSAVITMAPTSGGGAPAHTFRGTPSTQPYVVSINDVRSPKGTSLGALTNGQWFYTGGFLYVRDDTDLLASKTVEAGVRDSTIFTQGHTGVTVRNLQLQKTNGRIVRWAAGSNNGVCEDCVVRCGGDSASSNGGIEFSISTGCRASRNTLTDVQTDGIYCLNNTGGIVEDNTVNTCYGPYSDNIQFDFFPNQWANANPIVRRNTCSMLGTNSPKGNIIVFGDGALVEDNYCEYGGFGISCNGSDSIIRRNEGYHNGEYVPWGGSFYADAVLNDPSGGFPVVDNQTWENNVSTDSLRGFVFYGTNITRTALVVQNNTVTGATIAAFATTVPVTGSLLGNTLRTQPGAKVIDFSSVKSGGTWTSNNNIVGPQGTGFIRYAGTSYNTLAAYVAATGKDASSTLYVPSTTQTVQSAPVTFQVAAAVQALVIQSPTQGQLLEDPSPPVVGLASNGPDDATSVTVRIYSGATATGTPVVSHTSATSNTIWVWSAVAPDLANGVYTAQAEQATGGSTYGVAVYGVSPYQSTAAALRKSPPVTFTVAATAPPHPPTVTITTPSSGGVIADDGTATGSAGDDVIDDPDVTVVIYNNVGAVFRTVTVARSGTQWSYAFLPPLVPAAYQIEVTQGSDAGVATSGRRSFTVVPDVVVPPPVSAHRRGVRELPPLRQHLEAETPTGRFYRWGDGERPERTPSGMRQSSTMPGGYESLDCTLPRQPGVDYHDLVRLTTIRAKGAGGETLWEGRLERAPATSGDAMSVSPGAVGWQAALEDDKSVRFLGVDRNLQSWGGMSVQRRLNLMAISASAFDGSVAQDGVTGLPAVELQAAAPWVDSARPFVEAWYDSQGTGVGALWYSWKKALRISGSDPNWFWAAFLASDEVASGFDITANLRAEGPGSGVIAPTAARNFAAVQLTNSTAISEFFASWQFAVWFDSLAVIGTHQLPVRTSNDGTVGGLLASDIVRHVVPRFAPPLRVTAASVDQSGFVMDQFAYLEATTAGELVRQATRVGLQDWAVWDDQVFWWTNRGSQGREWRARISPAQLTETGPQVDRLWNGAVVQYQDVAGDTRSVGPPGSGADTVSSSLLDVDPTNPANELGIRRWDMLTMGVATPAVATQIGRRFLEEQRLLDTSGTAQFVGHVQDDRGVYHPASVVRAGDSVSFTDAADSSPRRIVRTDYDHDSRTCSVDLDSPPEGLAALLERLGVALVPLGVGV